MNSPQSKTDSKDSTGSWHKSACILCSINCGIEMRTDGLTIGRVRGDKAHPGSQGYTCEKALRLDHYQNGQHRLTSPMRRNPDGTYSEVDWDSAIAEIADRFNDLIETHGSDKILFYGGGGQGNHLGGAYGSATRSALGITYKSNALAQEKTGEFWVDGQLFGSPRCHTTGDYEEAEVSVFWGKNPWQSHGLPQARRVLKAIANDPDRVLMVVDPRLSESAKMADTHLRPRPGGDAHLLAAILACLVDDDLLNREWLDEHAAGLEDVLEAIAEIDIGESCDKSGVPEDQVRHAAAVLGKAKGGVSIFEDLGIQQAPHSTMNSYLEKLLVLLTGNFGVKGGMNLHSSLASLGGGRPVAKGEKGPVTPVTGHRIVTGLVPCNVIPDEILTDHPDRFRAMLIESGNPIHSMADSPRMREALRALDLVVVIDVAMTETAREADFVLPAASQFEKWECTFFSLEFPHNFFHLRRPVFAPREGTLPEAEIHRRLCRALGAYDDSDLGALHEAAAAGRQTYLDAFFTLAVERPELTGVAPVILYETLGPTLETPDGTPAAGAAAVWGLSHGAAMKWPDSIRRAGIAGDSLGDALFDHILASPSGITFTVDDYSETFERLQTEDGRIHLAIPSLLSELKTMAAGADGFEPDPDYPYILAAGERRSSTANTIYRDPGWRRTDRVGAMRISVEDAAELGLDEGALVRVTTRTGTAVSPVEVTNTLLPGHITLPNGFGLGPGGSSDYVGVAPNELTSTEDRDWFAGTPHHKHVRARLEAVG